MNKNNAASEENNMSSIGYSKNLAEDTAEIIREILKMDRLLYLNIIQNKESLTSLQMTREILALKSNLEPEKIKEEAMLKNNPNINKRLKDLTDLEILNVHEGKYTLTSIGSMVIDDLERLNSKIEILKKYKWFFSTHDYTAIPTQYFREIHNLRFAKQCEDAIEYHNQIESNTARITERILIVTERLHDIPSWIVDEFNRSNMTLKLVYYFKNPFELNYLDEQEQTLWKDLTQGTSSTVNLRYMTLRGGGPLGIRIVDRRWALFNLLEIEENKPNRPKSFYGTDERFVDWVENIFSYIWDTSKPLDPDKISIKYP